MRHRRASSTPYGGYPFWERLEDSVVFYPLFVLYFLGAALIVVAGWDQAGRPKP